jgi:glycosyltransferase involved in cell wall biosynthesis
VDHPTIDVSAIVLNHGRLSEKLKALGIPSTVVDESELSFTTLLRRVGARLKSNPPQIVHSHRYKENLIAALLKRRCRIPHLIRTVHGSIEHKAGVKGMKARLYAFLDTRTSKRFDAIVSVSEDLARQLGEQYPGSKVVTIHNAVEAATILPSRRREDVRRELGVADDQPLIGVVGRLVAVKGLERFLAVAKLIVAAHPRAAFLVVGDGPLHQECRQMVLDLGLQGKVLLTGFRDDVVDVINSLDIYAMTSHHEGIPMTLLEALALSRPVVAMSVGGIPEVIEDGVSGILVKSGDIERMAASCIRLMTEKPTAIELGRNARRRVESEFSILAHRQRVVELYQSVVRGQ